MIESSAFLPRRLNARVCEHMPSSTSSATSTPPLPPVSTSSKQDARREEQASLYRCRLAPAPACAGVVHSLHHVTPVVRRYVSQAARMSPAAMLSALCCFARWCSLSWQSVCLQWQCAVSVVHACHSTRARGWGEEVSCVCRVLKYVVSDGLRCDRSGLMVMR